MVGLLQEALTRVKRADSTVFRQRLVAEKISLDSLAKGGIVGARRPSHHLFPATQLLSHSASHSATEPATEPLSRSATQPLSQSAAQPLGWVAGWLSG